MLHTDFKEGEGMLDNTDAPGLTYAESGVDIKAQSTLVERIKGLAASTPRKGVVSGIGGFAALYELPLHQYPQPLLVSGSDGVGTKLKLAHALNRHDTIGIDLVAMCVNDVLCHRADPLYFLDYFATGQLNVDQATDIIRGIAEGCSRAGISLIGGETAELPGLYHGDDYDLAGFCVGIVDKKTMITPERVIPGDALIALASSGAHSNGYSLIRRVVEQSQVGLDFMIADKTLGDWLIEPTRIYVSALQSLWQRVEVHGMAHITGGGLVENCPRFLPAYTQARLSRDSWDWPELFTWLQARGNIADSEMLKTFNLGVGMVIAVAQEDVAKVLDHLAMQQEKAWVIGEVEASSAADPVVVW
jgi:phosphoribosylformylglycinamidine cyclo-ligase